MKKTLIIFTLIALIDVSPAISEEYLEKLEIKCEHPFTCPDALKPRVNFWLNIYFKYGQNDTIFHDPEVPERVYSVLKTDQNCPRRGKKDNPEIKAERERLRQLLITISDKLLFLDDPEFTSEEKEMLDLFPDRIVTDIREAAENIRCQKGNREMFLAGLQKYGAYRDFIVNTLRENALPEDLQYLPFVESSYDTKAFSHAGAAGLWQLMPKTARLHGLTVTRDFDERFDPLSATEVAVTYIKDDLFRIISKAFLNQMSEPGEINPEPFVLTSYNYGPNGMSRAIMEAGTDYLKVLDTYRARKFGNAVKNFYPSFLAARQLAKNPEQYFPQITYDPPFIFDEVAIPVAASPQRVADTLKISMDDLKTLNPAIGDSVWNSKKAKKPSLAKGFVLRVPKNGQPWNDLITFLPEKTTAKQKVATREPLRHPRSKTR